jgi:hypothetical protein
MGIHDFPLELCTFVARAAICPSLGDAPASVKVVKSIKLRPARGRWVANVIIRAQMPHESDVSSGSRFARELARRGASDSRIWLGNRGLVAIRYSKNCDFDKAPEKQQLFRFGP